MSNSFYRKDLTDAHERAGNRRVARRQLNNKMQFLKVMLTGGLAASGIHFQFTNKP